MSPPQEFVFVNSGSTSTGGHKISTTGRAFVIRKARAAQPWSTMRKKNPKGPSTMTKDAEVRPPSANSNERASGTLGQPAAGQQPVWQHVSSTEEVSSPGKEIQRRPRPKRNPSRTLWGGATCSRCQSKSCSCTPGVQAWMASQPDSLLDGRFDPFSTLSVALSPRDANLLGYFTNTICPRLTPVTTSTQAAEVQKYWVTISFAHPGFMHAALCLAALQLAVAEPHQSPFLLERFMHHRVQAISSIQHDLDDSKRALSDENIATVFHMLCIEENLYLHASDALASDPVWRHLQPDSAQREAHMAGLKRMLALRGGVARLGEMRGLQCFLIRWVCTSLGCRLVFSLPPTYRPEDRMEQEAARISEQTFAASHLLPQGLLSRLYNYPESSPFYHEGSRMADACRGVGMHPELLRHILTIDCLLKDATAWFNCRDGYTWDALDIQNLFSIVLGELVRWNLENESSLSATENVTAMCLFIFIFFVGNGAHGACSPLPGIMPRLRQHFADPHLRFLLQAAGIEIWVGLLLLISSTQNPASGDYFFRFYIDMLAGRLAQRQPAHTFEDVKAMISKCVWTPHMDMNARKAWDETAPVWGPIREALISGRQLPNLDTLTRPRPADIHVKPSIPLSNPYATSHMKKLFSSGIEAH
ncbi:hypothetical protein B0H63DRAFT_196116 [Podospora didyma]|uniref:Transcription factor domain-containing protein n=1 Tax=Podospora didyma TaxID=330526 RepID=A0AAE0NGJ4_9PEZI|nr:hypothetical protein B0H63DRAFT_196116 [Podospora didyma]